MTDHGASSQSLDMVRRMQLVLTGSSMDEHCREMLCSTFDRFLALEARRLSKRLLICVRDRKARIAALLTLLSELDQLTENETDRTVFVEMALLFDEISLTATAGSAALREFNRVKADFPVDQRNGDETTFLSSPWSPPCASVRYCRSRVKPERAETTALPGHIRSRSDPI
jgi:hypothetical protein